MTSLKSIIYLFVLIIVITLFGCTSNDKSYDFMDSNQFLTYTVYNATVSKLEYKDVIDKEFINIHTSDNEFNYDKIKVFQGYSFKTILDFNLEPYFKNNYTNKEIEIIVSVFGLYSSEYDNWYQEEMIILKTDTEIVGFLRPEISIINDLNPI